MADWFQRLPGFRPSPPGMERTILRSLPKVLVCGSLLLMLPALLVRLSQGAAAESGMASTSMTVDIFVVALIILYWTLGLTVAIGAFIVMVMKGPAFVADAYPLVDSEGPDADAPEGR